MEIVAAVALLLVVVWYARALTGDARFAKPLDFSALERTGRPNDYLVAPPSVTPTPPDRESPVFSAGPQDLAAAVARLVETAPRTRVLARGDDGLRFELVQRSLLLRFPDYISVRVLAREEGGSTLAIFSRSIYGHSDLGVNRKRIEGWLETLGTVLDGEASPGGA